MNWMWNMSIMNKYKPRGKEYNYGNFSENRRFRVQHLKTVCPEYEREMVIIAFDPNRR